MALQQPANKVFLNGKSLTYKPVTSWAEELSEPTPKVIASSITVTHDFELPEDDETTTTHIAKLLINFDDEGIDLNYQEKRKEDTSGWGVNSTLTIPSKVLAIKLAELILDYYGC
jgi:hypothetical protein